MTLDLANIPCAAFYVFDVRTDFRPRVQTSQNALRFLRPCRSLRPLHRVWRAGFERSRFRVPRCASLPPDAVWWWTRLDRFTVEPDHQNASHFGGGEGIRTPDPLLAGQVLSQLSYTPVPLSAGGSASPLERHRKPNNRSFAPDSRLCRDFFVLSSKNSGKSLSEIPHVLLRKEVIQPHLPIRLPCYDLTPIIEPTFGSSLLPVRTLTSGLPDFHGLTGGVYKARERIHRDILIRDY